LYAFIAIDREFPFLLHPEEVIFTTSFFWHSIFKKYDLAAKSDWLLMNAVSKNINLHLTYIFKPDKSSAADLLIQKLSAEFLQHLRTPSHQCANFNVG
jgi:hypothetical protein